MKKLLLITAFLANSITVNAAPAIMAEDFHKLNSAIANAIKDESLVQKVITSRLNSTLLDIELLSKEHFDLGMYDLSFGPWYTKIRDRSLNRRFMEYYKKYKNSAQDFLSKVENIRWLGASLKWHDAYAKIYLDLADKLEVIGLGLLNEELYQSEKELDLDQLANELVEDIVVRMNSRKDPNGYLPQNATNESALKMIEDYLNNKARGFSSARDLEATDVLSAYFSYLSKDKLDEFKHILKNKVAKPAAVQAPAAESKVEAKQQISGKSSGESSGVVVSPAATAATTNSITTNSVPAVDSQTGPAIPQEQFADLLEEQERNLLGFLGNMSPEEREAMGQEAEAMEKYINNLSPEERMKLEQAFEDEMNEIE